MEAQVIIIIVSASIYAARLIYKGVKWIFKRVKTSSCYVNDEMIISVNLKSVDQSIQDIAQKEQLSDTEIAKIKLIVEGLLKDKITKQKSK